MKLNLTIIADYLQGIEIIGRQIKNELDFLFDRAEIYMGEQTLTDDCLYILRAEELADLDHKAPLSLLCIGLCEEKKHNWDIVSVPEKTDRAVLLNQVFGIITRFYDWDYRLMKECYDTGSLHNLGSIGFEVFQNCLSGWDAQERMLFLSYFPGKQLPFLYPKTAEEYLDEDMRKILEKTPMYQQALQERLPALYPAGTYNLATLYYNILDQDTHLAHLGVECHDRDFIPSDYCLLMHFGKYVKMALKNDHSLPVNSVPELEQVMRKLIQGEPVGARELTSVLRKMHWDGGDYYRCMTISFRKENVPNASLYGSITYLAHLYKDLYIDRMDNGLLLLFHMEKPETAVPNEESLLYFLQVNHGDAGIGNSFRGFEKLSDYYKQAFYTLETGKKKSPDRRLYRFDEYALDVLMDYGMNMLREEANYTGGLLTLKAYDREKNTEYEKTLREYLYCNFNAAETFRRLHIHKTSFLYRLERIKELSGLDVRDYRTRLYLMLLFEHTETNKGKDA